MKQIYIDASDWLRENERERGSIIITNKKSKGKHCRSKQNIMWDKWLLVRCAKLLLQAKYK